MSNCNPILITGCPRSGATMIAASVQICGAFGGEMSKRGMFSNDRIREELVKPYIRKQQGDTEGQKYIVPTKKVSIPIAWKDDVFSILQQQKYTDGSWMYKDFRSALIWPVWHYTYPNAKWVIVRRRTGDIVRSCMKTAYMNAYSTEAGWIEWVRQYEEKFVEMITEGLNCKIIWPERMVHGDYHQLYELMEWLGLPWNKEALKYIDTLLWKNK